VAGFEDFFMGNLGQKKIPEGDLSKEIKKKVGIVAVFIVTKR